MTSERGRYRYVKPCGHDAFVVYPTRLYNLEMKRCADVLKKGGMDAVLSGITVNIRMKGFTSTLYRTGRLLVVPCSSGSDAIRVADSVFSVLSSDRKVLKSMNDAEEVL
ncbi:MAG: hypothetical protein KIY12_01545 [Thermoplasmata archaeon]|uniref:Uncharacterized protein n=1 Tax=Candidatus Sysuiplasma superficiale TaxID=2823368 RepID=A0A8J8CBG1_9ARCH|nr:hypothetical protein [Candidatus Sysuiplasma superficiale]MBX8643401.1 hypothetical protein [Candidatus Sysuiplasma superficiale]MCL4347466.1 hypothetical protein [Candidatus Thermoplasmatota archaeon]MCL5437233.1 hypothetical protein [Candidatus Thermoplasmatota archaeon]